MDTEQLKSIAAQLSHPHGEKGIEMATMMNETNISVTRHSIQQLHCENGNHVLELGHGNAGHLTYLMAQAHNIIYAGLDIAELMIAEATKINQQLVAQKRVSFTQYDGLHIPFADNTFHRIFTVNTLYFWSDPALLLSELYRVLKQDGLLAITFAHASFMKQLPFTSYGFTLYNPDDVEALVARTPFKLSTIDTQTEQVKSKTGAQVERTFSTITLKK